MAGIFDLKKGAFDSSEAARLYEAYAIALQGLRATASGDDRSLSQRLASAIVKAARGEPDCLKNDGTIDPVRLAQRAVLRMLQVNKDDPKAAPRDRAQPAVSPDPAPEPTTKAPESPGKVMMRIFDGTRFAKL